MSTIHTYLNGKPVDHVVENYEHISPASSYVKVLGALFVLTGLTYAVSYADLGSASLAVAMIVAFIKATLVCMFFMHLKYDDRYHVFVFLSALMFVAIFFILTIFDIESRSRLNEEEATFYRINSGVTYDDAARAKNYQAYEAEKAASGAEVPSAAAAQGEPAGEAAPGAPAEAAPPAH